MRQLVLESYFVQFVVAKRRSTVGIVIVATAHEYVEADKASTSVAHTRLHKGLGSTFVAVSPSTQK
jgi:hypothetical protein